MEETINVRIPKTLYDRLVRLRKKNYLPVSAMLRKGLSEFCVRNEALEKRVDSVLRKDK